MRGDKKPSFRTSLKVRMDKISKICEETYGKLAKEKLNKQVKG